jgi:hypothetical protein
LLDTSTSDVVNIIRTNHRLGQSRWPARMLSVAFVAVRKPLAIVGKAKDHFDTKQSSHAMAVRLGETQTAIQSPTRRSKESKAIHSTKDAETQKKELILEHLPPLPLVLIVLFCSGALLVFSLRDFLTTGRNIGGRFDEAMMVRLPSLATF